MMCKDETSRRSINDHAHHGGAHQGHPGQLPPSGKDARRAGRAATDAIVRVEPVDNWHKDWPQVLSAIERTGQRDALHVDPQGWLSARQVLMVAFAPGTNRVAGHLCFRITPAAGADGDVFVEARLDAMGVQPGFESVQLNVAATLRRAAEQRAKALKCRRLIGLPKPTRADA